MIIKLRPSAASLLIAALVAFASCSGEKSPPPPAKAGDTTNYSVRRYILGQIEKLRGEPFVLTRTFTEGARKDSAYVLLDSVNWKEIIPVFSASDISSPAYVGAYDFNSAEDAVTSSQVLTYSARRRDLFTQTFQITTDPLNFKVKSIYIETRKSGFWRSTSQKLLYVPMGVIQIQQTDDPLIGGTKQTRLELQFPRINPDNVNIEEETL